MKPAKKKQARRVIPTPEAPIKQPGTVASEAPFNLGLKSWHIGGLILTVAVMAVTALAWICIHDPKISFLSRDARAEWILFPRAMDASVHSALTLDTVFRREFTLADQPRAARLDLRAAKSVELKINGTRVEIAATDNWKNGVTANIGSFLRPGPNTIEAKVFNDVAPPALWLTLTADQQTLRSDATWESSCTGSAFRPAALAVTPILPGPGNPMEGGEETFAALRGVWLCWLLFAGIAIALCLAGYRWLGRSAESPAGGGLSRRQMMGLLGAIGGLWLLLFWNNAGLMPFLTGFDSEAHRDYIKYIQERHALPLPTEGFEMFQPPLFYIVSAAALSLGGLSVDSHSAILVLRFLTFVFGILQFGLVFLSLRLFFPSRLTAQLVGLGLAAFLPMQLYLSHYVTNETLAATLVTASVYLGLRLLRTRDPTIAQLAWLGLAMGAAMLAKATALLLVGPIFVALLIKLVADRAPVAIWIRQFGTVAAVFAATCGWHYARIWLRFGTPLLGNWDAASGFSWWQDPGFHTAGDYFRFGKALAAPLFSGLWSFADGIYSTLWGDGLCGGVPKLSFRPPWNYDLMLAGYFLAIGPTVVILVGASIALWRFIRKPTAEWFVLFGLTGAVTLGVVYMTMKVACYGQVKAFYGLALLVPFCFFGAIGWEVLTRGRRIWQGVLGVLLLVWALNSFASFWIVRSTTQQVYAGLRWGGEHNPEAAMVEARRAVEADPNSASAQRLLALALTDAGRATEALPHAQRAVELNPLDGACHLRLGMVLARQDQFEPAINEARRAVELGPENLSAYSFLLACLARMGRSEETIGVARDALVISPFNPELHQTLGVALAQKQDFVTAAQQFGYALLLRSDFPPARSNFRLALRYLGKGPDGLQRLQEVASFVPDTPVLLNEVAWFFATQSDPALRNGNEAIRLAERAAILTNRADARILATLAAAFAEAGRIPEATKIADEARGRAQSSGEADNVTMTEKLLAAFQRGSAYHEEPTPK